MLDKQGQIDLLKVAIQIISKNGCGGLGCHACPINKDYHGDSDLCNVLKSKLTDEREKLYKS